MVQSGFDESDHERTGRSRLSIEDLYREYFPAILSTCKKFLNTEADIKDVMQEVFLKLVKNHASFRGKSGGELIQWIRKITENECKSLLRDMQKTRRRNAAIEIGYQLGELASHDTMEENSAVLVRRNIPGYLEEYVNRQTKNDRNILQLSIFRARPPNKIARRLGKPTWHEYRVIKSLRDSLSQMLGGHK